MSILWRTRICYQFVFFARINSVINDANEEISLRHCLPTDVLAVAQELNVNFNVCRSNSTLLLCKNWATQNPDSDIFWRPNNLIYWFFLFSQRSMKSFGKHVVVQSAGRLCWRRNNKCKMIMINISSWNIFDGIEMESHLSWSRSFLLLPPHRSFSGHDTRFQRLARSPLSFRQIRSDFNRSHRHKLRSASLEASVLSLSNDTLWALLI